MFTVSSTRHGPHWCRQFRRPKTLGSNLATLRPEFGSPARVQPVCVVVDDIPVNRLLSGLEVRAVGAPDLLVLQCAEEALHEGVSVGMAVVAELAGDAQRSQRVDVATGGELAAVVATDVQSRPAHGVILWETELNGLLQHLQVPKPGVI